MAGSIKSILKSSSTVSFSSGRKPSGVRNDGGFPSSGFLWVTPAPLFGSGAGSLVEAFLEKKPSRWAKRSGRVSRTRRTWAGSSPVGKGIGLPSKVFHFAVLLMLREGGGPVLNGMASVGLACFCHWLWRGSDWICARRAEISTVSSSAEGRRHGAVRIRWILLSWWIFRSLRSASAWASLSIFGTVLGTGIAGAYRARAGLSSGQPNERVFGCSQTSCLTNQS